MNIFEQIKAGKSKITEFKIDLPKSEQISKTAIAFANTGGGKILIGVDDAGQIVGMPSSKVADYIDRLSNMLHDKIHPFLLPDIYTVAFEERNIIVVEVYPSPLKPHFLKNEGKNGGTYIRVGATNKQADPPYIQELERQRIHVSYDSELDLFTPASKVLTEELKQLLLKNTGTPFTDLDLRNKHLMELQGGTSFYTNAVEILLGHAENVKIRCARFKGTEPDVFIDRKTLEGDLFTQIENGIKFLLSHINLGGEIGDDHIKRVDLYEIPPEALREALINAVVHRNYATMNSDIKIAVFDDRVEITSPGDLPNGITLDDALAGRSEVRNKVLAGIFEIAEMIEQWGRGIRKIISSCEAAGLRRPEIIESGMFIQVRIFRKTENDSGRKTRTQKPDAKARISGSYSRVSIAKSRDYGG